MSEKTYKVIVARYGMRQSDIHGTLAEAVSLCHYDIEHNQAMPLHIIEQNRSIIKDTLLWTHEYIKGGEALHVFAKRHNIPLIEI